MPVIKAPSFWCPAFFNHQVKVASSARSSGLYNSFHAGIFEQICILFERTTVPVVSFSLDSCGAVSVNVPGGNVCLGSSVCPTLSIAAGRATRQRQGFRYYSVNTLYNPHHAFLSKWQCSDVWAASVRTVLLKLLLCVVPNTIVVGSTPTSDVVKALLPRFYIQKYCF
jgi:hypothetical protein